MTRLKRNGATELSEQRIRDYLSAFSTAEPQGVAQHVSDDFMNLHLTALTDGCIGKETYVSRLREFLSEYENIDYEVRRVVCDGNNGAVQYVMNFDQAGVSYAIQGIMWFEFRNGLISQRTDCWDGITYLRQSHLSDMDQLRLLKPSSKL